MAKNIPSISDLTNWLINNPVKYDKRGRSKPTGVPDAARALGYTGPPLKIREGNLTNGRESLRISLKGKSSRSNYFRALAQARTTPDKAERAAAYSKIKDLNKQGLVADHRLTNSALANGEEFVRATRGEKGVQQMRDLYKKVGGYGHSPENIQGLTKEENGTKEKQERKLRGNKRNKTAYYQHLENKPPVTNPDFAKWDKKRQSYVQQIDNPLAKLADTVRQPPRATRDVTQPNPSNSPLAALAEATRTGNTNTLGDTHALGGGVADTDPLGILPTPRFRTP
jgi:hypothetical protein